MLVALVTQKSPPFTMTLPSASMAVPGQNMSWTVLVTSLATGSVGFAGSSRTVWVWSRPGPDA
jgi:hypothetical protein